VGETRKKTFGAPFRSQAEIMLKKEEGGARTSTDFQSSTTRRTKKEKKIGDPSSAVALDPRQRRDRLNRGAEKKRGRPASGSQEKTGKKKKKGVMRVRNPAGTNEHSRGT